MDNTITLEGKIEAETAKAILIEFTAGPKVWIPKSQLRDRTLRDPQEKLWDFEITEWIAKKNELI